MSNQSPWSALAGRAAGKWQLPLLGLSLLALPAALYLLRPNPKSMPLGQVLSAIEALVSAGAYAEAVELGQIATARADCDGPIAGTVYLQTARAMFCSAQASKRLTANVSRTIADHYRQAAEHSAAFDADDYVKLGRALEWGKQYRLAAAWLEEALQKEYPDKPGLLRHIYLLKRDKLQASPGELTALLEDILESSPPDRLESIAWGLEERLGLMARTSEIEAAEGLLSRYEGRFRGSDFESLFDYLHAWVHFQSGRLQEAELALRALRNRLSPEEPASAKAGWLLGRTILADAANDRSEEANSFFRDVLAKHPVGPYAVASRVGSAEAMSALGRHTEAIELYRFAIEDFPSVEITGLVDRDVVRTSLLVTAERQRQLGDLKAALSYAELAVSLVDWNVVEPAIAHLEKLAQLQSELAEHTGGLDDARGLAASRAAFRQAAETYLKIAGLALQDDERAADAAWQAAELYARAADRSEAIELYRAFGETRPSHPLVPRAFLRMGQLQQSAGRLNEAIAAYQECYRRFPKLLDGIRALVPLAQCYVSRGPGDLELAEKTLRIILQESEVFTPAAPEFADALFLLGEVLERLGQYEQAVATLKEAVDRYPDDARVWRARFLLADSYRQSAFALKNDVMGEDERGSADRMRDEADSRFAAARQVYRELIDQYELRRTTELNALEKVYLRHAYLYEADCYFEARLYREALARYDQAAGLLRGSPSALAAYVQIINCHVFLGESAEARAALARAQVLVDRMKVEVFRDSASPETQADWKEYFQWLGKAEVF